MTSKSYSVAVLPGEGIGPEVIESSVRILTYLAESSGINIEMQYALIGEPARKKFGDYFPEETDAICRRSDGILFGAISKGGILELRKAFDFYANIRPVSIHASLLDKSALKPELVESLDILFVRELAGGIYFGEAARSRDDSGDFGYHTMIYHDWEIRRIARKALQLASERRGHVTVAHKQNALPHLHWTRIVAEEAVDFEGVTVDEMLVDNMAMQLVRRPCQFDVILAGNLFGDILSDLGGALTGSIGLLSSVSLNHEGKGLYEPIHGTAPDISGKGIANPIGMIGSVALMLEQWGETDLSDKLQTAISCVLAKGYRTADLLPTPAEISVTTDQLTDHIMAELGLSFS